MKSSNAKLNLGMLTWDFDPPRGGLGRVLKEYAMELDIGNVANPQNFLKRTKCKGGNILFSLLLPFTLQKWIDKNQITELILPVGPGGVFLIRKPKRCKLVMICYHTYFQQSRDVPMQFWKKIFVPFERRTFKMADRVLCFAEDTEGVLKKHHAVDYPVLLPQLIRSEDWMKKRSAKKKSGLCVCIARLEKRKGIDVLLKAWRRVNESNTNAELIIVGDGILRRNVDRKINSLRGAKRIRSLPEDDLIKLVQQAEVIICPSYLEGFGLTAVEGMLAGTAVIGTDCDGLRSLINNRKDGFLVPAGNPEALAEAIDHVLREKDLRRSIIEEAKNNACKRFEEERARDELYAAVKAL